MGINIIDGISGHERDIDDTRFSTNMMLLRIAEALERMLEIEIEKRNMEEDDKFRRLTKQHAT